MHFETGCDIAGWIHLAQDKDNYRLLVSPVMKFVVP
jgi:hypothetical protein